MLVTLMSLVMLFQEALMKDPSIIYEFARTARRGPTEAELSNFRTGMHSAAL